MMKDRKEPADSCGGRLRHVRAEEGRNQPDMAELVGVAARTYAYYERDEREVGANVLRLLAERGWSPLWILTGEGDERLSPNALPGAATDTALVVARGDRVAEARRDEYIKAQGQGGIDEKAMTKALTLVEEAIEGRGLAPAERAELIGLVYSLVVAPGELPTASITRLIRAASGDRGNARQDQQDSRDPAEHRRAKGGESTG